MRLVAVALVVLLAGPAEAGELSIRERWLHRGLFLTTEALLVVDLGQTLDIKRHPGHVETNPLIGKHPSDDDVVAFFAALLVGHALAYWLLPERWSAGLELVQVGVSSGTIVNNYSLGLRVRF